MKRPKLTEKGLGLVAYLVVLFSFIVPIIYLVVRMILNGPNLASDSDIRTNADYFLMLLQSLLGVFAINVPTFIRKQFKFELPTTLYIMFIVFLYCAIFLGEFYSFYYRFEYWDVVLHSFSSVMAGAFAFVVVALLNREKNTSMNLSPFFVALFAFCFSVTIGSVWEIYEFLADRTFGLNMQKFIKEGGEVLKGHAALSDTMEDIIVDCLGAFITSLTGYFSLKRGKGWASQYIARYTNKHAN